MSDEERKVRDRALVLFGLGDYSRAKAELIKYLSIDPQDALAHSLIALCFSNLADDKNAISYAKEALQHDAASDYSHYALAYCLYSAGMNHKALTSIDEAIKLSPEDAEYWALKSDITLAMSHAGITAKQALEFADSGLTFDPASQHCHSARARALFALKRTAEAKVELERSLQQSPLSDDLHTLRAWTLMEGGNIEKAKSAYEEALRLNPNSESARLGLLSSLRGKHILYRLLLKLMAPSGQVKVSTIIAIVLLFYSIGAMAKIQTPFFQQLSLALAAPALFGALFLCGLLFTGNSIFNFVVMLDKSSRVHLTSSEKHSAVLTCACLFSASTMVIYAMLTGHILWYFSAGMTAILVFPVHLVYWFEPGRTRNFMYAYLTVDILATVCATMTLQVGDYLTKVYGVPDAIIGSCLISTIMISVVLSYLALYLETIIEHIVNLRSRIKSRF